MLFGDDRRICVWPTKIRPLDMPVLSIPAGRHNRDRHIQGRPAPHSGDVTVLLLLHLAQDEADRANHLPEAYNHESFDINCMQINVGVVIKALIQVYGFFVLITPRVGVDVAEVNFFKC